jgi:tRNA nucleotidyltransferase/poly(A) polymerase
MTAVPGLANGKLKDQALLNQGPLARALKVLNGEGEETRLVGDAVRDLALGPRKAKPPPKTATLPA